jgi:hypothetical protein
MNIIDVVTNYRDEIVVPYNTYNNTEDEPCHIVCTNDAN